MRMTGSWQPIWLQIQVRWSSNSRLLREFQSIFDLNAKVAPVTFARCRAWVSYGLVLSFPVSISVKVAVMLAGSEAAYCWTA